MTVTLDQITVPHDEPAPEGAGVMVVLDHTGHTTLAWNPDNADEVAAARTHFEKLRGKGYVAYGKNANGRDETVHSFDPAARELTLRPATAGG